ncbi:MAG: zinc metalloprotease [Planctomycetota bacterium]|jgi:hypothetical protein|nr:zinc metalloprotease [Planctomycetota bacterium]MDP6761975.1 zinc metalloprotease [Planctomycetota bacterium]MDP6987902.1 zinc metalloprotease [Planctomycetota bacterium]
MKSRITAAALLAALSFQAPAAQGPAQTPQSVITIGGRSYATWQSYVQSPFFKQNAMHCITPSRNPTINPSSGFNFSPSDCAYYSTNPNPIYDPTVVYTIQVVVHVIEHTNGQGAISNAMIQSQIDVLNEDFRALPGSNGAPGTDVMIQFELATQDPQGNATNGITNTVNNQWFNDNGNYWNTLAWDTNRYMNIYTNSCGGYLGYVPDLPQGGIVGNNSDRIVILWSAFGRNAPIGPPYNLGRTATHEVGHYLGLWHTFDNGCGSASACYTSGDLICDTNRENQPTYGCPGNKSGCGSPDPIHNYMDYSDDSCMWEFSFEQTNRMRCTLENYRPDVYGGSGPPPPPPPPGDVASINIDVGANNVFPAPSDSFGGAASQSGTWNAVSGTANNVSLDQVDGTPSGAVISVSGGNGNFASNNPGTTGDIQRLMDDIQDADTSTWTISGLGNGSYAVYVYAWAPDDPTSFLTDVTILGGSSGTQSCGGAAWGGSWVHGSHYVSDEVSVTNGSITVQIAPGSFSSPSSVNGFQIVELGGGSVGTAYCFGVNGACPCGNDGAGDEGCANSTGSGATLAAGGSTSAGADDLAFFAGGLLASQPALLFAGTASLNGGNGVSFGDGLRCAGGTVTRLGVEVPDASGQAIWGPGLGSSGGWSNGDTRYFQTWYRNPQGSPCGSGFNLTQGLSVSFTP